MLQNPVRRREKLSAVKEIKWRKFKVARTTLVLAFAFFIFYYSFWQHILLKYLAPPETPPIKIKMIVSAYYKPLPKQKNYFTGSYWQDLLLNGHGITFSGKTVAVGDAAADLKYYPVGFKFLVPGWGQVRVEDKGDFIKGPRRLDIFVGEGEEGLARSIQWGKKEIDVEIISHG